MDITYANIKLNGTPKDKHCGVAISVGNPVDLCISQDRTDCGEQTKQEDGNKTDLLACLDVELEENWQRQNGNNDIGNNGDNSIACE